MTPAVKSAPRAIGAACRRITSPNILTATGSQVSNVAIPASSGRKVGPGCYAQGSPARFTSVSKTAAAALVAVQARSTYVKPQLHNTVATINVEHIEPFSVAEMMKDPRCLLVDLRGEDRAAGLIDGSIHEPAIDKVPFITKVPDLVQRWRSKGIVIFTCQYSAHRAPQCANWYREKAPPQQRVAILEGGFRKWEGDGLPVKSVARGEEARAADKFALQVGTAFADWGVGLSASAGQETTAHTLALPSAPPAPTGRYHQLHAGVSRAGRVAGFEFHALVEACR